MALFDEAAKVRLLAIDAMERRDADYAGEVLSHEIRVAASAASFAATLGLGRAEIQAAYWAGRFHDVGKLSVPKEILFKRGPLDQDERLEIECHAEYGCEILTRGGLAMPEFLLDAVRHHHEAFDGAGYNGLRGAEIPLVARIVAIADVHDALCAERPYKAALGEEQALALMTAAAGRVCRDSFDPDLLRAFVATRLSKPGISDDARARLSGFAAAPRGLEGAGAGAGGRFEAPPPMRGFC